ncbi:hypothetical protein [Armatimonas sp.]|uniref:hypothetical protein n=1 Tax=Armatimonas sp. TaxID=1872638 RepID=UPI00286BDF3F|nr:hypothetical protein [Armatimonas sp.]
MKSNTSEPTQPLRLTRSSFLTALTLSVITSVAILQGCTSGGGGGDSGGSGNNFAEFSVSARKINLVCPGPSGGEIALENVSPNTLTIT